MYGDYMEQIPYIAYESALARQERTIKRLFIVTILLIALLVATNVGWIIYESQFEDVSTTIEADSDTGNAIANYSGDVTYNGESNGNS